MPDEKVYFESIDFGDGIPRHPRESAFANNVNENGCKNRFIFDMKEIIQRNTGGTWNRNTFTKTGATFTIDGDSVIFGGTPTGYVNFNFYQKISKPAIYKLSGLKDCTNVLFGGCTLYLNGSQVGSIVINSKNDTTLDLSAYTFDTINIDVKRAGNNVAMSGTAFIMLCLKSDWDLDNTWAVPSKTNLQLTQDSVTWDNLSEVGAVNYIYPTSSTNTDSAGVTWTLNSDNSVSVSSGGVAPSTGTGFSYRNNNAAFLRGKTVTFKANVTGNTPTYDKLYFAVICRETEKGANLVRYDLWPIDGQTEVTFTVPNNTNYILIGCNIQNGATTAIDCKISPMITPVSYNGSYVPYAKTNKELTEDVAELLNDGKPYSFGIMGSNTKPSFLNGDTLANKTILEIFSALPINSVGESYGTFAIGSEISVVTYSGTNTLFSDIMSLTGLTHIPAGLLTIKKTEAQRGLVTYNTGNKIFNCRIMNNALETCYLMELTPIT